MQITTEQLFCLEHTLAKAYLKQFTYPWEALQGISNLILELGDSLDSSEYNKIGNDVWIHKSANIYPTSYIAGPCIIGAETEVRHCAFIRGSALIGNHCVIGNSVEIKNSIIFDNCQVPHFNYVGDSILGYHAHMGAGSVTSNFKAGGKNINIHATPDIVTGLRKIGSFLGDYVDVGCNTVLNPGTIVGKNTVIYPCSNVRGIVPENSIYKTGTIIVSKEDR
ncbi:MAG: hypothetical protein HUK24_05860 [Sphaerochaetaceae bacterium]|nr:hypothetical protein [Sphaerochaetaceae bacterium]